MNNYQVTQWCRHFMEEAVAEGDLCIDATMGNGHDTCLLSRLAGSRGHVYAFDIQPQAVENTRRRLIQEHCPENYTLLCQSHTNLDTYVSPESVSLITFNFGYLPGGDHKLSTSAKSSVLAIQKGLPLLKRGGRMVLCIYSGGDTGFEERDAILSFLKTLPSREYLVIKSDYYNRPNHPPIPVLILRL